MPRYRSVLFAIGLLLVIVQGIGPTSIGGLPTRDSDGNDTFNDADKVYFSEFKVGSLSATDQIDIYELVELLGDDEYHVQKVSLSIIKLSGADVKARVYEETGAGIAEMRSAGERSEVAFVMPYDGSLFISVVTDPVGQVSTYRLETGGDTNVNNYEYNDGNNRPMVVGLSESSDVTDTLNPVRDIVDHRHMDIPPGKSLEVSFQSAAPLRMEVYNGTYSRLAEKGPNSNFSVRNDGAYPLRTLIRMYYPLMGGTLYPNVNAAYILSMVLWSHTTVPSVVPSDPWTAGLLLYEDQTEIVPLNLTRHFSEPSGDPLSFEMISAPPEIGARLVRVRDDYNPNIVLYQEIRFALEHNWHGEGTLTVRAFDRDGDVNDSIMVAVRSINDLPYISRIGAADHKGGVFNLYAEEDIPKTYSVTYGDDDDPIESLYFTTNETLPFLSVSNKNGTISIDARQEHIGKYNFNITLYDGSGGWSVVDLRLSIEPVNDPPSAPVIVSLSHPDLVIPPGEEVILSAMGASDIDSPVLSYSWDWGDGSTSVGNPGRHFFGLGVHGHRTVRVIVSDGQLSNMSSIVLFVQSPEDIAVGDLQTSVPDRAGDVMFIEERWRAETPQKRELTVMTVNERGVDILSVSTARRGNDLEVTLELDSTVEITGEFHYHVYLVKPGYREPFVDFRNLTDFDSAPDRMPNSTHVYAHRAFLGDPNLHNNSQGRIVNKNLLVFNIPFRELVTSGMPSPVKMSDIEVFALSVYEVPYIENKGQVSRFFMTDAAGVGALAHGNISSQDTTGGSSSNPFGDFARPTVIIVVVTLVLVVLFLGTVSFILVRRERKKRREEEKEFIERVEKMRSEGRDLFGREKVEEGPKEVSYEALYGAPAPEGHVASPGAPPPPQLPGPGLGVVPEAQSNIMVMKVSAGAPDESGPKQGAN